MITWTDVLGTEKNKEYFQEILRRVREDEMQHTVYPRAQDRFNAFKYTEFQNLKVIILGQDPYVNPGQAHGLCFSVPDGVKPPPSLINIYKEIEDDLKIQMDYQNGNLTCWACQGVLLLNAILTVRKGEPASHRNFGWEKFTDVVLEKISIFKKHCVFMLWGEFARKKSSLIDATKHLVLTANHPSPLSADRGFFGCKHFSKCNEYLLKNNLTPINWSNKF
ncbi:MAG: uracil-DNA glycosylase [Deltaproteobacteria bacterium]|nr:uracil-DNA glycosylase [Deltaproteobacteria bacterium]